MTSPIGPQATVDGQPTGRQHSWITRANTAVRLTHGIRSVPEPFSCLGRVRPAAAASARAHRPARLTLDLRAAPVLLDDGGVGTAEAAASAAGELARLSRIQASGRRRPRWWSQHPGGHRMEPRPVLLEPCCQPVALVHRPLDPSRAPKVTSRPGAARCLPLERATERRPTMQAPSGQVTAPAPQALLQDGALAAEWVLDPRCRRSRTPCSAWWGIPAVGRSQAGSAGPGLHSSDPRRRWSKRSSQWPRSVSSCGRAGGVGATLAAVTGWRDRQLTSKQAS
jgi:hypothetical protein